MSEVYRHLVPKIPVAFEGPDAQSRFDAVMETLNVRRQLLNLTYETRKARAEITILEAEAAGLQERLAQDAASPCLTATERRMVEGRRDLALATAELHQELIGQRILEIQALRATVQYHQEA
jgi:hypothetical protein